MKCGAPTLTGEPCRQPVRAGQAVCKRHLRYADRADNDAFYGESLSRARSRALARAGGLEGVNAELALMRLAVRDTFSVGDVEEARRAVDTIARLVKVKHDLDTKQAAQLTTSLDWVLDALAEDLTTPL